METTQNADRLLIQWHKQPNETGVAQPLSTYSVTEATLVSMGNAHISLNHNIKTENVDLTEQLAVNALTENTEWNVDIKSEVDEPTDHSTMLVDSSTGTAYYDTTQVSDDKKTVPLFSSNMDNKWSGLDMVSQHNNENTEWNVDIKSEVDEPTDYSTMLVDSSTGTAYNDTTQVSDDKKTVPLFSSNMDNKWSGLDMVSQHNNENTEWNVDIKSEVDEPTDYSYSSTGTAYNDTSQVSDDKKTVPIFSSNMDNKWSGLDMALQHNNDNSEICLITEVKTEIEANEETQLLSAHETPNLHTEIEIDETHEGHADDKSYLKRHLVLEHSTTKQIKKLYQNINIFSCSVCNCKFANQSSFKRHTRIHTGEKLFSCDLCDYKCTKKSYLTLHITTHSGEKPFSCDLCDYKSVRKSCLTRHIKIHTGEKPFSCNICDYKCISKSKLTRHMRTHTGEKPFSCDICDYKSISKPNLTLHMRTHTGEKPFSCDICDYKCISKPSLTLHMRTHTGEKPFSCNICDYKSISKKSLTLHMRTHTEEKPFSCDICDYKCIRKSCLTRHIKTHTGEKPFSCDICDYKCISKSKLTRHMRTHTREKPFSCDICDFKSKSKRKLTQHRRTHTGK